MGRRPIDPTWPKTTSGKLKGDPRTWATVADWLTQNGSSLTKLIMELGQTKMEWAPKKTVAARIQGLTAKEYNAVRESWGPDYPAAMSFKPIYGLRFGQLRDQHLRPPPPPVSEDVLREKLQGLGNREYERLRKQWGSEWPYYHDFPKIYGKTFKEIRDGKPHKGSWVDVAVVRERIQGLGSEEYDSTRRSWGPEYPVSAWFKRVYGQTFKQVRDGARMGDWPSVEEVREATKGLRSRDYDKQKQAHFPRSGSLKRIYGLTYDEISKGRRLNSGWVDEETLRQRIQGLTMDEYDQQRQAWGPEYPSSVFIKKAYGKTFGEIQRGGKKQPWLSEGEIRPYLQGLTLVEYDQRRKQLGPRFPSFQMFPKVYGKSLPEVRDAHPCAQPEAVRIVPEKERGPGGHDRGSVSFDLRPREASG